MKAQRHRGTRAQRRKAICPWGARVLVLAGATVLLVGSGVSVAADAAEGPTAKQVDAAVEGGLQWLAQQQVRDGADAGSWECRNPRYRTAVASLAGLAYLANGHLPGEGAYGERVANAMKYVHGSMNPEGYLGMGDRSGMYIHAICSLFGLSYLGMSPGDEQDRELAAWCRKALKVIVDAQAVRRPAVERGGWRYTPYSDESDVSVTSWQLLVLHAARQCGYAVEDRAFEQALGYINGAYVEKKTDAPGEEIAGFLYRPGVSQVPEPAATGVAVFIKSLLERRTDNRAMSSLSYLRNYPPSWGGPQYGGYFYFASFYMAQGMFQVGGSGWDRYSSELRRVLVEHQAGDGHWPFPPDNAPQSRLAGEPYATAMAVLILSLDKQYLPMYQRQKDIF